MPQSSIRRGTPVSLQQPCPICGKAKRCLISGDGRKVICYRNGDGCLRSATDRQGTPYYVHRHPDAPAQHDESPLHVETSRATPDELHQVYSALLSTLPLHSQHRDALQNRGLDAPGIAHRRYVSLGLPNRARRAQGLRDRFGDVVLKVPGIVVKPRDDGGNYLTISGKPGLLVPVRDVQGRIVALKVRVDDDDGSGKYRYLSSARHGGPGPGAPVHVPLGITGPCDTVRVTEGELKADAATVLSGVPTISVPGVGNWRGVVDVLTALEARRVLLAFDADVATNPDVAHHLRSCVAGLQSAGFTVDVETWPADRGKGIDDLLAAGGTPDVLTGDATAAFLATLSESPQKPQRDSVPNEATDDPHRLARLFRQRHGLTMALEPTLAFWRDEWQHWTGSAWKPIPVAELKAKLVPLIKAEFDLANIEAQATADPEKDSPTVQKVTRTLVENALMALQSLTLLPGRIDQPTWWEPQPNDPSPLAMLSTQNGLLHLTATGVQTLAPTPRFFTPNAVDYEFDPQATCPEWLRFLSTLWPDDAESIAALQEWFGYLLLPDTRLHKLLLIVGPPRSGKGTIGRVLKALIGAENVAAPTLGSLAEQFGMQSLLGKTVGLVADARLSGRADAVSVVERLLSISGEDPQDVQRKHLPTLAGIRLPVRFVILTNELPNLRDAAGALTTRMVVLRMTRSFVGREDRGLEPRLMRELSGILNWALTGWRRITSRVELLQPATGRELLDDLAELASPISQFLAERCIVGPEWSIPVADLFAEWKRWCEAHGRDHAGTEQTFGRDIRAALPQVSTRRPRVGGNRERWYFGVALRGSGPQWSADISIAREAETPILAPHSASPESRNRNGEDRGPSRTEDSPAVPAERQNNRPDPGYLDPLAKRNVRLDAPKVPPWIQSSAE